MRNIMLPFQLIFNIIYTGPETMANVLNAELVRECMVDLPSYTDYVVIRNVAQLVIYRESVLSKNFLFLLSCAMQAFYAELDTLISLLLQCGNSITKADDSNDLSNGDFQKGPLKNYLQENTSETMNASTRLSDLQNSMRDKRCFIALLSSLEAIMRSEFEQEDTSWPTVTQSLLLSSDMRDPAYNDFFEDLMISMLRGDISYCVRTICQLSNQRWLANIISHIFGDDGCEDQVEGIFMELSSVDTGETYQHVNTILKNCPFSRARLNNLDIDMAKSFIILLNNWFGSLEIFGQIKISESLSPSVNAPAIINNRHHDSRVAIGNISRSSKSLFPAERALFGLISGDIQLVIDYLPSWKRRGIGNNIYVRIYLELLLLHQNGVLSEDGFKRRLDGTLGKFVDMPGVTGHPAMLSHVILPICGNGALRSDAIESFLHLIYDNDHAFYSLAESYCSLRDPRESTFGFDLLNYQYLRDYGRYLVKNPNVTTKMLETLNSLQTLPLVKIRTGGFNKWLIQRDRALTNPVLYPIESKLNGSKKNFLNLQLARLQNIMRDWHQGMELDLKSVARVILMCDRGSFERYLEAFLLEFVKGLVNLTLSDLITKEQVRSGICPLAGYDILSLVDCTNYWLEMFSAVHGTEEFIISMIRPILSYVEHVEKDYVSILCWLKTVNKGEVANVLMKDIVAYPELLDSVESSSSVTGGIMRFIYSRYSQLVLFEHILRVTSLEPGIVLSEFMTKDTATEPEAGASQFSLEAIYDYSVVCGLLTRMETVMRIIRYTFWNCIDVYDEASCSEVEFNPHVRLNNIWGSSYLKQHLGDAVAAICESDSRQGLDPISTAVSYANWTFNGGVNILYSAEVVSILQECFTRSRNNRICEIVHYLVETLNYTQISKASDQAYEDLDLALTAWSLDPTDLTRYSDVVDKLPFSIAFDEKPANSVMLNNGVTYTSIYTAEVKHPLGVSTIASSIGACMNNTALYLLSVIMLDTLIAYSVAHLDHNSERANDIEKELYKSVKKLKSIANSDCAHLVTEFIRVYGLNVLRASRNCVDSFSEGVIHEFLSL